MRRLLCFICCVTGLSLHGDDAQAPATSPALVEPAYGSIEELVHYAIQGELSAQIQLAKLYEERGARERALHWYLAAAREGVREAQFKVSYWMLQAPAETREPEKAISWCRKSADQGFLPAMYNLGVAFEHGIGVEKNLSEARAWYSKAAELQEPYAQKALGVLCEKGKGGPQNLPEALFWYTLALRQGVAEARVLVENLQPRMTTTLKATFQKRLEDWDARHPFTKPAGLETVAPPKTVDFLN